MSDTVMVFTPAPQLTVTIEQQHDRPELHVHAGGQGVWQTRMITALGPEVVMCATVTDPLPAGGDAVRAYGVAASPAFIVVLALRSAFGPPPEVVQSGINRGANAGGAVLQSGTVGATLTASNAGLRGIAVSLDVLTPTAATAASGGAAIADLDRADDEKRNWDSAADLAVRLLPALAGTPAGTVLNLNVPDLPALEIRGLRRSRLARVGQVQLSIAEAGEDYVRTAVQGTPEPLEPGTDLADLAAHYATVTPIHAPAEVRALVLDLPPG